MYGGIVILSAKYANWNVHTAMIRQAPRLMWRARERGARAVVFAWPSRSPTCVPIQPLLSSPNFDNVPIFLVSWSTPTLCLRFRTIASCTYNYRRKASWARRIIGFTHR